MSQQLKQGSKGRPTQKSKESLSVCLCVCVSAWFKGVQRHICLDCNDTVNKIISEILYEFR